MAPEYLSTLCQLVSGIPGLRHLWSADRGHLDFPRLRLATYGGCPSAYASPSNWNSLPAHLRDDSLSLSTFICHLKTLLFSFCKNAFILYKSTVFKWHLFGHIASADPLQDHSRALQAAINHASAKWHHWTGWRRWTWTWVCTVELELHRCSIGLHLAW